MNIAIYKDKKNGKLEKQSWHKTGKQQKRLRWTSKLHYVAQKIFDKDLVEIHKKKTTLTLSKMLECAC